MDDLKEGKEYRVWVEGIKSGTPDVDCPKYFTGNPTEDDLTKLDEDNVLLIFEHSEYVEDAYHFNFDEATSLVTALYESDQEYYYEEIT